MKKLQVMFGVYAVIGLVFALVRHFSASSGHVLTAYDFGVHVSHALLWPIFMFPALGKFLGGLVLLGLIGAFVVLKGKE